MTTRWTGFDAIVPCGIADAAVTTLSAEVGRSVTVEDARPSVERHLRDLLSWQPFERSPDLTARDTSADPTEITYGLSALT